MANKRASRKSSTRSEPPMPPKDTSLGRQPTPLSSQAEIARREAVRLNDLKIQEAKMDFRRNEMENARHMSRGNRSQLNSNYSRQAQQQIDAMERQSPQGSRNSPKTSRPSNIPVSRLPDKLSGRTSEFGTRSLIEGMKSFMRGGGLRRGSM